MGTRASCSHAGVCSNEVEDRTGKINLPRLVAVTALHHHSSRRPSDDQELPRGRAVDRQRIDPIDGRVPLKVRDDVYQGHARPERQDNLPTAGRSASSANSNMRAPRPRPEPVISMRIISFLSRRRACFCDHHTRLMRERRRYFPRVPHPHNVRRPRGFGDTLGFRSQCGVYSCL